MKFQQFYLLFSKAYAIMEKAKSVNTFGCEVIYCDAKAQLELLTEMFQKQGHDIVYELKENSEMQEFWKMLLEYPQLLKGFEGVLFTLVLSGHCEECPYLEDVMTSPPMCSYYHQRAQEDGNVDFMAHLLPAMNLKQSQIEAAVINLQALDADVMRENLLGLLTPYLPK